MKQRRVILGIVALIILGLIGGGLWWTTQNNENNLPALDGPKEFVVQGNFVKNEIKSGEVFILIERIDESSGENKIIRGVVQRGKTIFSRFSDGKREALNMADVRPGQLLSFTSYQDPGILSRIVLESVSIIED